MMSEFGRIGDSIEIKLYINVGQEDPVKQTAYESIVIMKN